MTTTISYHGSTIATIENQAKTLTTAGKYVPYSFIVTDVTSGAGGDYSVDDIAMRNISGDISGSATSIGSYAFRGCSSLTAVNFPNAADIGSYAFMNCSALTAASFPNTVSIGTYAFVSCYALTTVSFPSATSIGNYAFAYCSLTTASFPSVISIGNYAFQSCSSLTTADFSNATSIGSYAFGFCSSLTTISFPNATYIGSDAFRNCISLTTVSLPNVTLIGSYAFRNCYNLLSFYLLGSSVPVLAASVFIYTPIGGNTASTGGVYGSIFVPESLVSDFKAAANWSAYSDRIVGISDSSSSSVPDTLAAKFVKRWYDTGSTASCSETYHYNTLPALPIVLGNPVTHLTYQIVTDDAFSAQLNGVTSPMGEGPHVYLSSAAPTNIDSMGTCIYSHADDGMDWSNVSAAFSVAAGNNGNYLTIHTWCDDWDNDICTEATVQVSLYSGEYYLLKK